MGIEGGFLTVIGQGVKGWHGAAARARVPDRAVCIWGEIRQSLFCKEDGDLPSMETTPSFSLRIY